MNFNETRSPETLRALLAYDPATGALTWRARDAATLTDHGLTVPNDLAHWNAANAGANAACDVGRGSLVVRIEGRRFRAQRVAWALYHGSWSIGQVRFVGVDRGDFSIGNLRVPSRLPARQRGDLQTNNRSGATGVHWRREGMLARTHQRRWAARGAWGVQTLS